MYLRGIWPRSGDVQDVIESTVDPSMFAEAYAGIFEGDHRWRALEVPEGQTFAWDDDSTYLRRPPYLDDMLREPLPVTDIGGARVLVKLGDSVTTDHARPRGRSPFTRPQGATSRDWVSSGSSSTPMRHVVAITK